MAPETPPRPAFPLRGLLVLPLALLWALPYAGYAALYATLAPRSFAARQDSIIRTWGTVILRLLGIRLEKSGRVQGPALIMFNHVSVLDLALLLSTWAGNSVILYKKEFHRYPLIGHALRAMRMIPIDRSDREAATESLHQAAARVRDEGLGVYVSPEGTRSKHGRLLPFKKGPFHLALETKLPIVPVVFQGIEKLIPDGSWLARSGTIKVNYLEAIETSNWERETLEKHIADVREVFLKYLPEA